MSSRFQILLRRASLYLNIGIRRESTSDESEEEIVFSKNNVCIHSVDRQNNELNHNLGYLTIKRNVNNSDVSEDKNSTLCLQWTPNECLSKHLEISSNNFKNCNQTNDSNEENSEINSIGIKNAQKESINAKNNKYEDIVFDFTKCDINTNENNNQNQQNSSHLSDSELKRRNSASGHELRDNRKELSPRRTQRCQSCRSTPLKRSITNENPINTFSVDLRQIKSLRLFFGEEDSDTNCDVLGADNSSGQLVIVSRDSFYKIFHFHCGGLDKLLTVLKSLDFWDKSETSRETNYLQFSICRPKLKSEECHPEEKLYVSVNERQWRDSINELGQITDQQTLRKTIFFAGIEPSLRQHIWPFLLQRYDYHSTYAQREAEDVIKCQEYHEIYQKLQKMSDSERDWFWRNVESIVEKDVVRTDRSNPFFAGEDNHNIDKMKRILINLALLCPKIGYTQGMSDLLAPLLAEIQSEDKTFWCFVSMMRWTRFVCSPKDTDMDHNLTLLRELLRLMIPQFYAYIRQFSDDLELLFTHRWILLCFKREFNEKEALHIWESCWAHYQTYYFHLFICLAIISVYGEDVISHQMDSDEILFHFSTLATNMNGNLILRKARGLFYQFCVLPRIPCSLKNVTKSGLEMWETNRQQEIECVQQLPNLSNWEHLCQCNTEDIPFPFGSFDTDSTPFD